jgi:hypothetical protein
VGALDDAPVTDRHDPATSLPDLAAHLDESRIRTYVEQRLASVRRLEEPVPHIVVNDIFEPSFDRLLAEAWPALELFKRDKAGRKYDLVPSSKAPDPRSSGYDRMPPDQRAVWDFFVATVNRDIVAPLLARIFQPEIQARLREIQDAFHAGLIAYPMAGTRDWSYRANAGRFMVRGNGYELKPHIDSMPYLLTVLHYFPDDDGDEHSGTIFYKPGRPLDFLTCVRDGSTQYFHESGVRCHEVLRIPFRPNTLVAFPNTLSAAHGAVAPSAALRKVFQYHISLKGDDEKV